MWVPGQGTKKNKDKLKKPEAKEASEEEQAEQEMEIEKEWAFKPVQIQDSLKRVKSKQQAKKF